MRPEETSNALYSAKNTNAKKLPIYSVLNPDTSSDSDSEKSKGARWHSAKVENTQIGIIKSKKVKLKEEILFTLYDMKRIKRLIIRVDRTTS
jgi:hypothetical protein